MKGTNESKYSNTVSCYAEETLLTEEEAIRFLKLDDGTTKHPESCLAYYRSEGVLRATRVGKKLRYLKSELLKFLEIQTKITNGEITRESLDKNPSQR